MTSLTSLCLPARPPPLVADIGVDHETEPARVQEMKDETLAPVEKAEAQHVPVKEVQHRAHEERHPCPRALGPETALIGCAKHRGTQSRCAGSLARWPFLRHQSRVAAVFGDPELEVVFLEVGLDQVVTEPR